MTGMRIYIVRAAAVLVLICGLLLAIAGSKRPEASFSKGRLDSYVATYQVSQVLNGMDPKVIGFQVRTVTASGESHLVCYKKDLHITETFVTPTSIYSLEGNSLQYGGKSIAPIMWSTYHSPESLLQSAQFQGKASIIGLEAYRLKVQDDGGTVERWYVPRLGHYPVWEMVSSKGFYQLTSILNVQFREVDSAEIAPPDLPVKFDKIDERARLAEEGGRFDYANGLRKQVREREMANDR